MDKDKLILKMAEFINTFDIDETICKHRPKEFDDCEEEGLDCIDCIISHFEGEI